MGYQDLVFPQIHKKLTDWLSENGASVISYNLNNRAFSLIELLAAIIILGLLSTVAIVGVSRLIEKARTNHYSVQEKSIVMASQAFLADQKDLMPREIGSSVIIELNEIQRAKAIGDVLDYNKEKCASEDSYVKVTSILMISIVIRFI